MKNPTTASILAVCVLLTGAGPPATARAGELHANPDLLGEIDAAIDEDIQRLAEIARGRPPGGDDVHRRLHLDGGGSWDGNQVTGNGNPLIDQGCHEGAMGAALESMMEHEGLDRHGAVDAIAGHLRERRATFAKSGVTYAQYAAHIAACKALCNVVVKQLIGCHVLAVRDLAEVELSIVATNLLDEEARNHVSFTKDEVLLPGRGARFGVRGTF